ncbi:Nodulation receptor kinase [Heracleum sosnowskyi]|uniref:non-specific serine/threonine protein kinase n=1 Tax=Heracleum sosnowskyi TaxID=360622 RepID=A0AAD8IEV3_9APIA|nr:Nodulation receptor kinase [Heracleum sosnowskyi]
MEGLSHWETRLLGFCILCISLILHQTRAQEGFKSIQSCAQTNFTDPKTNISWTTDDQWYPNISSCQEISPPSKLRVFSSTVGNKWCYSLKTRKDEIYLLRGTFKAGELQKAPPGTSFDVLIDITSIAIVKSSEDAVVEGIFKANDKYTNLCLSKERGDPYLLKLELRPLNSEYLKEKPSIALKVIDRVDVGSTGAEIRYPDDLFDRIWRPEPGDNNVTASPMTNIAIVNASRALPPIQVLRTALTHPEQLQFLHNNLDTGFYEYELYLYFLELNESVQAGQRLFNIYINGHKVAEMDIMAFGSRYRMLVLNFTANGALNLTMIKAANGSQLGPICNAYEILQIRPWIQGTNQEDKDAIFNVRNELLAFNPNNKVVVSWMGDPCLPLPWDGLFCESRDNSSAISKLDLSFKDLQGPLPQSITKLQKLRELNMSNNHFSQVIPGFPSSSVLTSVDLSHNNFMGNIPDSLALLPNLVTLLFGCNKKLSKDVPENLYRSTLDTDKGVCGGRRSSHKAKRIVIGTVAGGLLLIVGVIGISFWIYKRKVTANRRKFDVKGHPLTKNAIYSISSMDEIILQSISIQNFSLDSIETATQQYKTLIGEGGFGPVYRGTLSDGQEVAVKVRSATSTQGTREFDNELTLLSAIQHENLVPLLGYCNENDQQILVYPFMSNGSLQDRLYGEAAKRKTLDWPTRISIALGAARGLTYLHTFSSRSVIHRDVKSSNILLDNTMCAKVADFGFSKYAPQEGDSAASLEVRGTAGYLDPEYYSTQNLTAKSDVFSFGVVLLEIITGREPLNIKRPRTEWSLVEWAKPHIRNSRIDEIVDPNIKGWYHAEAMWRVVEVALSCTETFSAYRPSMVDIVRELEDALIIETNASEYMKSIDSFGGSNRFSIERPIAILPTPLPTEPSPILSQPSPPQPR